VTIYSRGLDLSNNHFFPKHWNRNLIRPLSNIVPSEGGKIFYYDRHDLHIRHLAFADFIDHVHWKEVRKGTARILINYYDDYFHAEDIKSFCETLVEKRIPSNKVFFLAMDPLWINFARKWFDTYGLDQVHITDLPLLAYAALNAYNSAGELREPITHRFSMLSRNYRPWRLDLALRLALNGVLENTIYSFHNLDPYGGHVYDREEIYQDLVKLGYDRNNKYIKRWVKHIPYSVGSPSNKYSTFTLRTVARSSIHILIESHYTPYLMGNTIPVESANYTPQEWSPAFATEKFYKAILLSKPIVVASTPHFLEEMESLGYRFNCFIQRTYDSAATNSERARLIASELLRLNSMTDNELTVCLEEIQPQLEHNKKLLLDYLHQPKLTHEFEFLKPYVGNPGGAPR